MAGIYYIHAKTAPGDRIFEDRDGDNTSADNWVIYRLSDVFLLYAGACIKTNNYDGAGTYINKVRERARNACYALLPMGDPDVPAHVECIPAEIAISVTGDALLTAMKNERRIELNAELKKMLITM